MKKCSILILCLINGFCMAQNNNKLTNDDIRNMLDNNSNAILNHVMRQEFSRIAKTNTNGNLGNYVGISTKDDNLSFGYNFIRQKGIIDLNVSGGINEGVATIFSSQKINSGVSIGVNYNRLFMRNKITFDSYEASNILEKDVELRDQYYKHKNSDFLDSTKLVKDYQEKKKNFEKLDKDLMVLKMGKDKPFFDIELNNKLKVQQTLLVKDTILLNKRINNFSEILNAKVTELRKKRDDSNNNDPFKDLQFELDSLKANQLLDNYKKELKKKTAELASTNKKIEANQYNKETFLKKKKELERKLKISEHDLNQAEIKLKNFVDGGAAKKYNVKDDLYEKQIRENLLKVNNIKALDVRLFWITVGGKIKNESFTLFDNTQQIDNQFDSKSDLTPSFNLSATYYENVSAKSNLNLSQRRIKYFTLGFTLSYGNNLKKLTQVDVYTTDSILPNRSIEKTQKAYQGEFKSEVFTGQIFSDYYQFIGDKDNIGFHIRGTIDLGPHSPVTSFRFGLLYAAIKKGETQSVANFEIFYGLNDIFKSGEEQSLFGRNILGIQTSFPFNFKLKPE